MLSISHKHTGRQLFITLSILLLTAALCMAQSTQPASTNAAVSATAALQGVVTDEHGAVVAGATVIIRDAARKAEIETTTASDGRFNFTELLPGNYVLSVRQQGFSTAEVRDVLLKVNEQRELKVRLRVGHIDETVTITDEPAIIKKSMATGVTLERQTLEELPLNGRTLQTAILLAPGTVATRATFTEQGQLSVNGQRANANYFMLDGVSANIGVAAGASGTGQAGTGSLPSTSVMGTTNTLVSVDALQELRILTSPFAPEYGRTPGAQVIMTTRTGTNQFHGSFFEYFRGDVLGAKDWFASAGGATLPSSHTHNFGGVFSGPIFKDRTFFFLSYEGLNANLPQFATRDVPSMAARAQALPQLRPFLNAFPVPNGPVRSNPALAEFSAAYMDSASFHAGSLRLDQRISDRVNIFARYHYAPSEIVQRGAGSSLNNPLHMSFKTETMTLGSTQSITQNLINDFRINYSSSTGKKFFEIDNFGSAVPFNGANIFPSYALSADSFYSLSLGGNTSLLLGKDASSFQDQINVVDNLSFNLGAHQLKVGFDYRRLTAIYDEWKYRENAIFNPSMDDLKAGLASNVILSVQDRTAINFTNFSVYAQDTWRIKRRLSLTYGLRWEYNPAPIGEGEQQSLFTVEGLNNSQNLTLAPQGTPLYQTTYNNFAPRFGFAFQLSEKQGLETMVRGGFGIFYDLGSGPLGNSASSFPYQRRKTFFYYYYPLEPIYNTPIPYTQTYPVGLIRVADPNLQLPRVMHWNFGIEQSLGSKQTLSATFVRANGRRLLRTELLLYPNQNFERVYVTTNQATSDYSAVQVQFQRRLSRGLQAVASYTYANSSDIASNDSSINLPIVSGYDAALDRGPSDFDVRHSFMAAISYDIPSFVKEGFGGALLRNWSIDTLINARTSAPIDLFSRRNSEFGNFTLRPDLVAGEPFYISDPHAPGGRRLNPAAFTKPNELRQGTLPRNSLRGFPLTQVDLALHRRFALTDRMSLQFRMEVFNLFNHPNFGDPVGDLSSDQFGWSTSMLGRNQTANNSTGFNPLFQMGGPRAVQFAVKFQF